MPSRSNSERPMPDINEIRLKEGKDAALAAIDKAREKYRQQPEAENVVALPTREQPRQQKEPAATATVPFSEDDLALQFASTNTDIRYVDEMGKWLLFDGKLWVFDRTKIVFNKARLICREASRRCNEKNAAALASRKSVWA